MGAHAGANLRLLTDQQMVLDANGKPRPTARITMTSIATPSWPRVRSAAAQRLARTRLRRSRRPGPSSVATVTASPWSVQPTTFQAGGFDRFFGSPSWALVILGNAERHCLAIVVEHFRCYGSHFRSGKPLDRFI
jgi:hypothetical protein